MCHKCRQRSQYRLGKKPGKKGKRIVKPKAVTERFRMRKLDLIAVESINP